MSERLPGPGDDSCLGTDVILKQAFLYLPSFNPVHLAGQFPAGPAVSVHAAGGWDPALGAAPSRALRCGDQASIQQVASRSHPCAEQLRPLQAALQDAG